MDNKHSTARLHADGKSCPVLVRHSRPGIKSYTWHNMKYIIMCVNDTVPVQPMFRAESMWMTFVFQWLKRLTRLKQRSPCSPWATGWALKLLACNLPIFSCVWNDFMNCKDELFYWLYSDRYLFEKILLYKLALIWKHFKLVSYVA